MRAVEFTINIETGEFTILVEGIAGPACEEVAMLVMDLAGKPRHDEATAEYQLRPRVHRHVDNRVRGTQG